MGQAEKKVKRGRGKRKRRISHGGTKAQREEKKGVGGRGRSSS